MSETRYSRYWVPFNFHDFFGYFMPGFFSVATIFIFMCCYMQGFYDVILEYYHTISDVRLSFILLLLSIFLLLTYTLGHLIATFGRILFDMIIMRGVIGRPIEKYLKLTPELERTVSKSTYKYILSLINLLIIVTILPINYFVYRIIIVAILSLMSMFVVFRLIIALIRIYKGDNYLKNLEANTVMKFLSDKFDAIYTFPCRLAIDPVINVIKRLFAIDKEFSDEFVDTFKLMYNDKFKLSSTNAQTDNIWLPYYYITATNSNVTSLLKNWFNLYKFSRNISTASYATALSVSMYLFLNNIECSYTVKLYLFTILAIAWLFGIRYWLIYSINYTKGIMRAFVVLSQVEIKSGEK